MSAFELCAKEAAAIAEQLTEQRTSLMLRANNSTLDLVAETLMQPTPAQAGVETYVSGVVRQYPHTPETLDHILTNAIGEEGEAVNGFIRKLHQVVIPLHKAVTDAIVKESQPKPLLNRIKIKWWSPLGKDLPIEECVTFDKEPAPKPVLQSMPISPDNALSDFQQGRALTDKMIDVLSKQEDVDIDTVHRAMFGMNPVPGNLPTHTFTPVRRIASALIIINLCDHYQRNPQATRGIAFTAEEYEKRLDEFAQWAEADLYFQMELLSLSRSSGSVILGNSFEGDDNVVYLDRYFADKFTTEVGDIRVVTAACFDQDGSFSNAYSSLTTLAANRSELIQKWTRMEWVHREQQEKDMFKHQRSILSDIAEGYGAKYGLGHEQVQLCTVSGVNVDTVIYDAKNIPLQQRINKFIGECVFNCPLTYAFLEKFDGLPTVSSTQPVNELTVRILQCFISVYVETLMSRSVVREGFQPIEV